MECLQDLTLVISNVACTVYNAWIDIELTQSYSDLADFWEIVHDIFDGPIGYREAKRLRNLGVKEFLGMSDDDLADVFDGGYCDENGKEIPCTIREIFVRDFGVDGLRKISEKRYEVIWGT